MNKKEQYQYDRLQKLLFAERERSHKVWEGYRDALYELVDLKMKLEAVKKALHGTE